MNDEPKTSHPCYGMVALTVLAQLGYQGAVDRVMVAIRDNPEATELVNRGCPLMEQRHDTGGDTKNKT